MTNLLSIFRETIVVLYYDKNKFEVILRNGDLLGNYIMYLREDAYKKL